MLGAIPYAGAAAQEVFGHLITPTLDRRREEWFDRLLDRLEQMEAQGGFDPSSLRSNEAFTTALLEATTAALRTHQEEKLEALRNAVLNVAAGTAPDEAPQHIYLSLVSRFTPLHIQMLRWAALPHEPAQSPTGKLPASITTFGEALPALMDHPVLTRQLFMDLSSNDLIEGGTLYAGTHLGDSHRPWATDFGRGLLAFISQPQL